VPENIIGLVAGDARDAEGWYRLGCDLEATSAAQARYAYHRALEHDARHPGALVNLGRLCHEAGNPRAAEIRYRLALAARPDHAVAAYNLGIALEDLGRPAEARAAYERAIALDPAAADAHFNLARLCEAQGDRMRALGHLMVHRRIVQQAGATTANHAPAG